MAKTQFKIPVAGQRVKKHQVTAIHLMAGLLLSLIGAITWAVPEGLKEEDNKFLNVSGILYFLAGLTIIAIAVFFNKKIIQSKANFLLRNLEVLLFIPMLIYSISQQWYLPAAYAGAAILTVILAFYWEKRGEQTYHAIINEEGVQLPLKGRNGQLHWSAIAKLMVRHNILTIDCKNNKLIQLTIQPNESIKEKSEAIELFSAHQIVQFKNKVAADW